MEVFTGPLEQLRHFASPDFLNTVLTAVRYTPAITGTIPYPLQILLGHLTTYAVNGLFNAQEEQAIINFLKEDYAEFLAKNEKEWAAKHPSESTRGIIPQGTNEHKVNNLGQFKDGHVGLIGTTRAGKTTQFILYLIQDFFPEFETFFIVESGLNPETSANLRKAGLYSMRVLHNQGENDEQIAYFNTDDASKAMSQMNNMNHDKNKLVLFDDTQVSMSNTDFGEIAKYISVAKNAKVQCVVSLHDPYATNNEKKARGGFRYFVLFNVNENQFNRIQGLHVGNRRWAKYNEIVDKYDRVVIYDTDTKELYDKNGAYFLPLMASEPESKKLKI